MKKDNAALRDINNLKGPHKINLQLFANESANSPDEPKIYTREELDKLLQQEADRRVSEALKTAKVKRDK